MGPHPDFVKAFHHVIDPPLALLQGLLRSEHRRVLLRGMAASARPSDSHQTAVKSAGSRSILQSRQSLPILAGSTLNPYMIPSSLWIHGGPLVTCSQGAPIWKALVLRLQPLLTMHSSLHGAMVKHIRVFNRKVTRAWHRVLLYLFLLLSKPFSFQHVPPPTHIPIRYPILSKFMVAS